MAGPDDGAAAVPPLLAAAPVGSVVETCPAGHAIAATIGARLAAHGGAALIVDYGHAGPATGDTLQAVRGHARADPLADPGDSDLTAHVDFTALAVAAAAGGAVRAWGPVGQGDFLRALGIDARAAALKRTADAGAGGRDRCRRRPADRRRRDGYAVQGHGADAATAAAPPGFA